MNRCTCDHPPALHRVAPVRGCAFEGCGCGAFWEFGCSVEEDLWARFAAGAIVSTSPGADAVRAAGFADKLLSEWRRRFRASNRGET